MAKEVRYELPRAFGDKKKPFYSKMFRRKKPKDMQKLADEVQKELDIPVDSPKEIANREHTAAKIQALDEGRHVINERFMRVAEQVGDMRAEIRQLEQEQREITLKSTKAVDMVDKVKPETFYARLEKQDARMEGLMAKIEQSKELNQKVMEELREIQRKTNIFRGVDQVAKLNKEAKENLSDIEKIDRSAKQHADKVEEIYGEIKKSSEKIEFTERVSKEVRKDMDEAIAKMTAISTRFDSAATKEDISAAMQENEEATEETIGMLNEVKEDVANCIQALEGIDKIKDAGNKVTQFVRDSQHRDDALGLHIDKVSDRMGKMEIQLASIKHEIQAMNRQERRVLNDIAKLKLKEQNDVKRIANQLHKQVKKLRQQEKKELKRPTVKIPKPPAPAPPVKKIKRLWKKKAVVEPAPPVMPAPPVRKIKRVWKKKVLVEPTLPVMPEPPMITPKKVTPKTKKKTPKKVAKKKPIPKEKAPPKKPRKSRKILRPARM
ncbi:hypothetical protein GOV11_05290 [Candidatus Woesearchaeota archaeon]|nr:hypothetical protein [Candidatus Woesearchaeota archaeon]